MTTRASGAPRRPPGRCIRRLAAVLAVAWVLASCGGSGPEPPRLVLLYATCTVNASYLSPFNDEVEFTPNLQRFADGSVVFSRHQTEAGQSGIAYASILTGAQADHHGAYRHPVQLPDDLYLVSEAYADQDYETFLWNDHKMASPRLNYGQGVRPENVVEGRLTATEPKFLELLERLEAEPGSRAFVLTNFTITHGPYRGAHLNRFLEEYAPDTGGLTRADMLKYLQLQRENYQELSYNLPGAIARLGLSATELDELARVSELLYAANVNALDREFGAIVDLLEARGLLDDSLVVFTADHGEQLYRPNALFHWSHAMQLAPEVLRVPLIVRAPGLAPGRYEAVTRSIDLFPTMTGLSGLSLQKDRGVEGVDLSPALRGEESPPSLRAYSHSTVLVRGVHQRMYSPQHRHKWELLKQYFPDEKVGWIWVAIREGDTLYKLRQLEPGSWGVEVFDLTVPPSLARDLFDADNPEHARMARQLASYKRHLVDNYRQLHGLPEEEEMQELRGLGYIQ